MVSNGYRVCIGGYPLTVPIVDRGRAHFAFNILSRMIDEGVEFYQDGKYIDLQQGIYFFDGNGNDVEPVLDKEWYYDIYGDNPKAAKEAVLDRIIADMEAEGAKPDRAFEAELMDKYTVCTYDEDKCSVRFAPTTWDLDKANEMQNMLTYGLDPSVDMFFKGHAINGGVYIINEDGDVYEDTPNEDWANEVKDDDQKFADAIAAISEPDNQVTL